MKRCRVCGALAQPGARCMACWVHARALAYELNGLLWFELKRAALVAALIGRWEGLMAGVELETPATLAERISKRPGRAIRAEKLTELIEDLDRFAERRKNDERDADDAGSAPAGS